MTTVQINVAIAESLGWTKIGRKGFGSTQIVGAMPKEPYWNFTPLPNYCNSLDACADFERTLGAAQHWQFRQALWHITEAKDGEVNGEEHNRRYCSATALQRCEAYLRVKGLWIN